MLKQEGESTKEQSDCIKLEMLKDKLRNVVNQRRNDSLSKLEEQSTQLLPAVKNDRNIFDDMQGGEREGQAAVAPAKLAEL